MIRLHMLTHARNRADGHPPLRCCVAGNEHRISYADLQKKYCHVASDTLPRLLQHALTAQRLRACLNIEGDRSLLVAGAISNVLSQHAILRQKCKKIALKLQ